LPSDVFLSVAGYPTGEVEWEAFEEGFRESVDIVYDSRQLFKESIVKENLLKEGEGDQNEVINFILHLIDDALVPVYENFQNRTKKVKQLWGLVKTSARKLFNP
jgi:hypothetical protein